MINFITRPLFHLVIFGIILTSLFSFTPPAMAQPPEDSAVIIMYHRFGEDNFPTTNVSLEQFDAHLAELKDKKYNIVPLAEIVTALRNKQKLPPRTIAITIDDAYLSIWEKAWPRLKAANIPFTIFVSTAPVTRHFLSYMSWQQIRDLARDPLVTIGHHGHSHDHLIYMSKDEAEKDIKTASAIYQTELGYIPDIFAYPFGEFSPMLENILKEEGFKAAFGQFSSAASSDRNLYGLPRFAFNEKYADLERFRLIVNARALPIYDILPISPILTKNPPQIGFTVAEDVSGLSALSCYPSHLSQAANIVRIGQNRIEIRFDTPLPEGRSRLNCTMPSTEKDSDKRWYWFGLPFFVK